MDYQTMRSLADSWGLMFLVLAFAGLVGWAFRPAARDHHARARLLPFTDDQPHDEETGR